MSNCGRNGRRWLSEACRYLELALVDLFDALKLLTFSDLLKIFRGTIKKCNTDMSLL
jgi:hypothetical protein